MNKITNVSSKLLFLAGIPLVFLVGIIFSIMIIGAQNNETSQKTIETRLNQTQIINSIIRAYTHNIIDVAHKARTGMLLWSDAESTVAVGKKSITTNWKALNAIALNAEESKLVKESKPLYEQSLQTIEKLEGYIKEQSSYSMGNFVDLDLYTSLDPLLAKFDSLVLLQSRLASSEMEETSNATAQLNWMLSIATGVVILAVMLLAASIIRSIKTPLSQLKDTMHAVENQSDLSLRVEVKSRDEFAEIGNSFNQMMEKIGLLVNSILESGEMLEQAAENMIAACQQANSQTSATQDELSSAATSVEEMTQTAVSIQQFTEQTAQVTEEADAFVAKNFTTLKESTVHIRQLAAAINQSAEQVNILREHGQKIDSILSVIKTVAEQTNLLALNAAIEAARAGEQGRGFAVVADEVRGLAQRTQESTKEIESVIANIRDATEIAAEQMHSNADNVNKNAAAFQQTEETLQRIMSSFSNIIEQNSAAKEIFNEQTQAVKSVNETVHRIYSLAENSASTTNNAFDNAQKVEKLSSKLKDSLTSFNY